MQGVMKKNIFFVAVCVVVLFIATIATQLVDGVVAPFKSFSNRTLTIRGVTYIPASQLDTQHTRGYFMAILKKREVWVGKCITRKQAVRRIQSDQDVFCMTRQEALNAAQRAGKGRIPVGPEIHRSKNTYEKFYYHYHTYNRKGGHAFYFYNE